MKPDQQRTTKKMLDANRKDLADLWHDCDLLLRRIEQMESQVAAALEALEAANQGDTQ